MRAAATFGVLVTAALIGAALLMSGSDATAAGAHWASQPTSETPSTPVISATLTVTPTNTLAATATSTTAPTAAPAPVFLPIALREPRCDPVEEHIDLAIVLDGSAYMKKLRGGQPAWEAGLAMVRTILDTMDLDPAGGQDQISIVVFRHRNNILPEESLELTRAKEDARAFIDDLEYGDPRDTARMDVGVRHGHGFLKSSRRIPANDPVLIVISELQPKNVPYEDEPSCEDQDENCTMLKRADEVKADGVVFVVFATGQENRAPELNAMATDPSYAFVLPDEEAIRELYARLAPTIPCPPEQFWPYPGR